MTVKHLKAYHIKADANYLYIIVSPPNFTLLINGEEFQLLPTKAKEIIIHRREKKIANPDVEFAFQKSKDIIYITMIELMRIPDFLTLISSIAAPFFLEDTFEYREVADEILIDELERLNIKRLIDKALDERDEKMFYALLKLL